MAMPTITPQDTETLFGTGSGAWDYPWWTIAGEHGISYQPTVDSADDWHIMLSVDYGGHVVEPSRVDHQELMRTINRIISPNGPHIPHLSADVRRECRTLKFQGADAADFDAPMADEVLQVLMFGEVQYA